MASRQPSAQVSRQQTASSKPPGNSPSALQRIMPEVPSSPNVMSQMSAGRSSLREALISKLLKKYSPVCAYSERSNVTSLSFLAASRKQQNG